MVIRVQHHSRMWIESKQDSFTIYLLCYFMDTLKKRPMPAMHTIECADSNNGIAKDRKRRKIIVNLHGHKGRRSEVAANKKALRREPFLLQKTDLTSHIELATKHLFAINNHIENVITCRVLTDIQVK